MVMPRWSMVYFWWISNVMLHMFIMWVPKDVKLIMIVPHTCGTAALVTLVSNAWRSSMLMDLWTHSFLEKFETCEPCLLVYMHEETPCKWTVRTHLILNHLRHANHTTWARWLKGLVFSEMEQESNLLEVIHFDVCSPMSVEARSGYRYVLTSRMIWVDTEYIYLMNHESELLKGSSNFRVKLKIVVTRG